MRLSRVERDGGVIGAVAHRDGHVHRLEVGAVEQQDELERPLWLRLRLVLEQRREASQQQLGC
eukprot:2104466-Pleurochrysis_carterae.AAC.1